MYWRIYLSLGIDDLIMFSVWPTHWFVINISIKYQFVKHSLRIVAIVYMSTGTFPPYSSFYLLFCFRYSWDVIDISNGEMILQFSGVWDDKNLKLTRQPCKSINITIYCTRINASLTWSRAYDLYSFHEKRHKSQDLHKTAFSPDILY